MSFVFEFRKEGSTLDDLFSSSSSHLVLPSLSKLNNSTSWVEHDPMEILSSVALCAGGALAAARAGSRSNLSSGSTAAKPPPSPRVVALGITNQRESTIAWDRKTGRPLHRSIVWNDGRTAEICARVEREHGGKVRRFRFRFRVFFFFFFDLFSLKNRRKQNCFSHNRTASAPSRACPCPPTSRPTRCSGS